jgi:hypothetical protein
LLALFFDIFVFYHAKDLKILRDEDEHEPKNDMIDPHFEKNGDKTRKHSSGVV